MKTIFIKDDRLREIIADRNEKIVKMMLSGELKGSYTIKQSTKEFKTKKYPFYAIYFGWEITDHKDEWKIDEPDSRFEIIIEKSDDHYCATCKQLFTENVVCSLMVCGKTVEATLIRFIKELKAQRKTLCVRGRVIEGKLAESIYEDGWKLKAKSLPDNKALEGGGTTARV